MPKFRVTDDGLNSYGFRVLTSGIDIADFKANPVMFMNHDRNCLPIGKWNNLKKEESEMFADPEFDQDDELALKIQKKVDKGYLNMASIGFQVMEISDDPKLMLKGQTLPTVTRCKLKEISIADIGGNKRALKLWDKDGNEVNIDDPQSVNLCFGTLNQNATQMKDFLKKIAVMIGLADNASEQDVEAAFKKKLDELALANGKIVTLTKENEDLKKAMSEQKNAALELKLSDPKKKLTDEQKNHIRSIAKHDYELAMKSIDLIPDYKKLSDFVEDDKDGVISKERKDWTFNDWQKKDGKGLAELKDKHPDVYAELRKTLK